VVIEPNCSLTWRQSMAFLIGTSVVSLSIAAVFAAKGYWMIFPFAGLELLALGAAFYAVANAARRREVVSITASSVTVEKGRIRSRAGYGGPLSRDEFPRDWTRVEIVDEQDGTPSRSRLWVGAYGRRVELADFLVEGEKRRLARQLNELIKSA
jgi:uncharacterized membrane protein